MKRFLPILGFLLFVIQADAQNCSDVFISEIVEGWSNNKAVEIYNPTPDPVDLSEYGLVRFANGSTDFGEISYLTGMIVEPYDVIVIVLEKLDSLGEGLEAPVWDELQEAADYYINPNYDDGIWPMYFNGNDAVALVKDEGETLVDLFGRIGEGAEFAGWNPYIDSEGVQSYISQDHTLVRKMEVQQGQSVNPSSFDVLVQWDSLPANTFDQLGTHLSLCQPIDIAEESAATFMIFPNPVNGDVISVLSDKPISGIRILSMDGRLLREIKSVNDIILRTELHGLPGGSLIVEIIHSDGFIGRERIIR